ncbi:Uncharacterised protein [uncultured archaeon]|nr:Uncharacterised protein [uncultured archaeon]
MKKFLILLIIIGMFASIPLVSAVPTENEYGNVKAWFNGEEATVKGVKLKIGEPSDIKVTVNSNISGHVIIKLTNPLVTEPYEVVEGINIGNRDDNLNILSGWSKTITWKLKPNGAWKDGNAPINVLVQFTKIENGKIKGDKKIEFTIADPYILDEQYSGSTPSQTTGAAPPLPTGTSSTQKETPFLGAAGALAVMLAVWMWKRR